MDLRKLSNQEKNNIALIGKKGRHSIKTAHRVRVTAYLDTISHLLEDGKLEAEDVYDEFISLNRRPIRKSMENDFVNPARHIKLKPREEDVNQVNDDHTLQEDDDYDDNMLKNFQNYTNGGRVDSYNNDIIKTKYHKSDVNLQKDGEKESISDSKHQKTTRSNSDDTSSLTLMGKLQRTPTVINDRGKSRHTSNSIISIQ